MIVNSTYSNPYVGGLGADLPQNRQTFSLSVDKDMLDQLISAMERAGLDPAKLKATPDQPRQNSVTEPDPRQNPVTTVAPAAAQASDASFVPSFRFATSRGPDGIDWTVNSTYFASRESAEWIAQKYGTGEVIEKDFGGSGGPFAVQEREFHIKLADGRTVNAGILAAYYDRNPESRFPGVADSLIRSLLKSEA